MRNILSLRRDRRLAAERLVIALTAGDTTHPVTGGMVKVTQALRPNIAISQDRRAATKERMLRTAEYAVADGTPDAGSRDTEMPAKDVHHALIDFNGVRVHLADVEPLPQQRAVRLAWDLVEVGDHAAGEAP